ncbi:NHL repeat-containing protein [Lignipirellula cremea]|uniref:SMP-30/Gluconolaconase/LRE-like region n=1 Tax=Lignipirellula cremea TaxID=2528010 RepID=A0A518E4B7_9BACT|nr:hypothetical protein [Lignipirellula cremea]QDU98965.1 SMP-30/Gluconolaconase/LRE-like region [Lignipirellula cremea]
MIKRNLVAVLFVLLLASAMIAAEPVQWVSKPALTWNEQNQQGTVTFELASLTDVEVAIIHPATGEIVRHLAAGVLGPQAPPPLVANSRAQRIVWDGADDYGNPAPLPSDLVVRVRAGMSVALEQIVGGDPYLYYSDEVGDNDHSPWGINGLEAKSDGKVYVWGHSSNLGPPALRQYDVDGNYLQTLFPMPAGKDPSAMQGWGINLRPDGGYSPKFNLLTSPSLTTTFLDARLHMARLLPTAEKDRLQFWRTGLTDGAFDLMTINTDGTIAEDPAEQLLGPLVKHPPFGYGPVAPNKVDIHSLIGPVFVCFAPDGESFFLSGLYAATTVYGNERDVEMDSFWRDGQVWKVDVKTRTAKVFFALDKQEIPTTKRDRAVAYGGSRSYAALHGVAVNAAGNVFVCDRLHQRILVLDPQGAIVRELPVEHPDAIALSKKTGVLYVTTRSGDTRGSGAVRLLRFPDWRKDNAPSEDIEVSPQGYNREQSHSYVVVCDTDQGSNVWVAHSQMPVRIYRDHGAGLQLLKDFYRVEGAQRCVGFDRMQVDPKTEEVYLLDDHDTVWKVSDWKNPQFVKVPLETACIAIDARRRHIFGRTLRDGSSSNSVGRIARFHLEQDYAPANYGNTGTHCVTEQMHYEWCFDGNSDKGVAVAPNGNLAVVGKTQDGLRVFAGNDNQLPWAGLKIADLPNNAGGVRFDLAGNLYVGYVDKRPTIALPGFEEDKYLPAIGRIHKYAPTGTLQSGNLFPQAPAGPTHTYDVLYGAFETQCVTRSPRFGLDGYGRIYYPTNIAQRVSVIDNAGNEILHFGTYGNRDAKGGLPGDQTSSRDIPLAFPNSVDATDNYIYVADMVNLRLLRLQKDFQQEATSE